MDDRTNEVWLADLRTDGTAARAQSDLGRVLRRGLGRALGGRAGVDDASLDDFAQEACVKVLGRLDSYRGESRFTTWAVAVGEVDLGTTDGQYLLRARLNVSLPELDREVAQAIVDGAHQTCPYSKATRGNIEVTINLA